MYGAEIIILIEIKHVEKGNCQFETYLESKASWF